MEQKLFIYEFEDYISESILTEKSIYHDYMYDLRRMSDFVSQIGRPLTDEEIKQFVVKK